MLQMRIWSFVHTHTLPTHIRSKSCVLETLSKQLNGARSAKLQLSPRISDRVLPSRTIHRSKQWHQRYVKVPRNVLSPTQLQRAISMHFVFKVSSGYAVLMFGPCSKETAKIKSHCIETSTFRDCFLRRNMLWRSDLMYLVSHPSGFQIPGNTHFQQQGCLFWRSRQGFCVVPVYQRMRFCTEKILLGTDLHCRFQELKRYI